MEVREEYYEFDVDAAPKVLGWGKTSISWTLAVGRVDCFLFFRFAVGMT
jgi:hypothetical protein